MTLVRIIKDWDFPDLVRQTPGNSSVWDGVQFTTEAVPACDYVIVLNRVPESTTVVCPPKHVWVIIQEPPVAEYHWYRLGFDSFYRVYTQDTDVKGSKYVYSQPALPWHVLRSYDELKNSIPPEKPKPLSWITSNITGRSGHRKRMAFLETLHSQLDFDLWGRGFTPIKDKWDGLAPYRYALAVENYSGPYYWTEKLADCLLSWALPIYYGCTNITDYFPPEALVRIDIYKPDEAVEIIRETIHSDLWLMQRDAIAYARELILDQYQLFPFVTKLIGRWETDHSAERPKTVYLPKLPYLYGHTVRHPHSLRRVLSTLRRRLYRGY